MKPKKHEKKPEIKIEDAPDMVCVGFTATRNPDGSFNPSVPLYRPAELGGVEDDFDNLTWNQLIKLFDSMVREREKVKEILGDAESEEEEWNL